MRYSKKKLFLKHLKDIEHKFLILSIAFLIIVKADRLNQPIFVDE